MYLHPNELNTHLYDYQLQQVVECDTSIVSAAISAAITEVRGYLATRFDTGKIFSAEGDGRDALILDFVKTVAVWRIIKLSNVDIIYDKYRDLYKDATDYLARVAAGELMLDLPRLTDTDGKPVGGTVKISSNPKFHHYFN